jgi:hypothetical protein
MAKITEIISLLYELFSFPFDPGLLVDQFTVSITNLIGLSSTNLNFEYIDFFGDIYGNLVLLSRNVILPVGYAILAYFLVIDMYQLFSRAESMSGESAIQLPLKVVLKTVLFKFILDRSHDLLEGIHKIILYIQNLVFISAYRQTISQDAIDNFMADVSKMGFFQKIMLFIEIHIYSAISIVLVAIVLIVAVARIFEIYIYVFIAPIPLATLPGTDLNYIGKNFLKNFIAICLQGVIIALLLFLYAQFARNFIVGTDLKGLFWKGVSAALILTYCLFKSASWAKSICNAM